MIAGGGGPRLQLCQPRNATRMKGTAAATAAGLACYRFDAKPGRQIDPRFLSNHRTIVIEAKADVERFAAQLIASNVFLVQIRSLTEGQTSAEFQLGGAQAAIDAAFNGCPLSTH